MVHKPGRGCQAVLTMVPPLVMVALRPPRDTCGWEIGGIAAFGGKTSHEHLQGLLQNPGLVTFSVVQLCSN